ncbi:hypothetical protein LCGC14_0710490, partial [marine sediment metagenome]
VTAYTGVPFEDNLSKLSVFSDLYYYLYQNKLAIHVFPKHVIQSKNKPLTQFTAGIFFAFKNKELTQTSPINVEVFYEFTDIFKTTDNNFRLTERNNIGLRFTFPINFQPFNY